jgi:hypothetical protein
MDDGNEQRFAIKLCFKAGLSAAETPVLVRKAYVNLYEDFLFYYFLL